MLIRRAAKSTRNHAERMRKSFSVVAQSPRLIRLAHATRRRRFIEHNQSAITIRHKRYARHIPNDSHHDRRAEPLKESSSMRSLGVGRPLNGGIGS